MSTITRHRLRAIIERAILTAEDQWLSPENAERLRRAAGTMTTVTFGTYERNGCRCPAVFAGVLDDHGRVAHRPSGAIGILAFTCAFDASMRNLLGTVGGQVIEVVE